MKKWWIAAITALLVISMAIGVTMAIASSGSNGESQEAHEDEQEQAQDPSQAKITAEQAKETALAANPGATITEVELEKERGNLVWGVEFSSGVEVEIDAENGQIIGTEQPEPNEAQEEER